MIYKRKLGQQVAPSSLVKLSDAATRWREFLDGLNILSSSERFVCMCRVVEAMENEKNLVQIQILEDGLLPYAEADCRGTRIRIRESVYNDAAEGGRRSNFTIAHELAHAVLHHDEEPTAYGFQANPTHPIYCDSEWQADTFASLFLSPTYMMSSRITAAKIYADFNLSMEAAISRLRILKDERKRAV